MHASSSVFQRLAFFPLRRGLCLRLALLALCVVMVSGCGKRPAKVDAPQDASPIVYPRVYPDLATDPTP